MIDFFKELFSYNHQHNQQLLEIFREQRTKTSEKAIKWINHVVNAHYVWNSRILAMPLLFDGWYIHQTEALKDLDDNNLANSLRILDEFEPDAIVNYANFKGELFANSVRDILFHVINHSTYHRGQIAADFRQTGIEPIVSDYIFYKRRQP